MRTAQTDEWMPVPRCGGVFGGASDSNLNKYDKKKYAKNVTEE